MIIVLRNCMNTRFQDYRSMASLSVSALVLLATLSLLDSDWGANAAGRDRDSAVHLSRHRMLGKKNNAPLNGLFFGKRQSGSGNRAIFRQAAIGLRTIFWQASHFRPVFWQASRLQIAQQRRHWSGKRIRK
jgi:hypothetical protein